MALVARGFAEKQFVAFLHLGRNGTLVAFCLPAVPRRVAADPRALIVSNRLTDTLVRYHVGSKCLLEVRHVPVGLQRRHHYVEGAAHRLWVGDWTYIEFVNRFDTAVPKEVWIQGPSFIDQSRRLTRDAAPVRHWKCETLTTNAFGNGLLFRKSDLGHMACGTRNRVVRRKPFIKE